MGRSGKEWVPRASDETSLGNLAQVRPRTLHRRVAGGKGKMGPSHLVASPRVVAQNGFDARNVKVAQTKKETGISHDAFSRDRGRNGAYLLVPVIPGLSNDRFQGSEFFIRH